ncbi:hypothetical protein GCM10016234_11230 [Tianweitania populi]|uniref:Uncharacterized protein n=1 Tax=Tianweitania populi TaxID=1607949 RepID=A0A8J3GJW8_9HYPH|nr:hypothetical protein GCM10016234_11230 [Tianweitania populi]
MTGEIVRAGTCNLFDHAEPSSDHAAVGQFASTYDTIHTFPDQIHKALPFTEMDTEAKMSGQEGRQCW